MHKTKIDWADFSWNPVVGCTGSCPYCYARKMAHRFHRDFVPHWVEKNFQQPMPREPGARIFVNSMSDVADWQDDWFDKVTARVAQHPEHLFLFLSKRPWEAPWTTLPNAMLGYTVTRQTDCRWEQVPGSASFLSIEPILERIMLPASWRPRWIICGSETGNRKGKVVPSVEWLCDIKKFALLHDIPVFFKESLRSVWYPGSTIAAAAFPQELPECGWQREEEGYEG